MPAFLTGLPSQRHQLPFQGMSTARNTGRAQREKRIKGLKITISSPRCPQNGVDFRYMLRIPRDIEIPVQREEEFACANLDVTIPTPSAASPSATRLPVFVWIHGKEIACDQRWFALPKMGANIASSRRRLTDGVVWK